MHKHTANTDACLVAARNNKLRSSSYHSKTQSFDEEVDGIDGRELSSLLMVIKLNGFDMN